MRKKKGRKDSRWPTRQGGGKRTKMLKSGLITKFFNYCILGIQKDKLKDEPRGGGGGGGGGGQKGLLGIL